MKDMTPRQALYRFTVAISWIYVIVFLLITPSSHLLGALVEIVLGAAFAFLGWTQPTLEVEQNNKHISLIYKGITAFWMINAGMDIAYFMAH